MKVNRTAISILIVFLAQILINNAFATSSDSPCSKKNKILLNSATKEHFLKAGIDESNLKNYFCVPSDLTKDYPIFSPTETIIYQWISRSVSNNVTNNIRSEYLGTIDWGAYSASIPEYHNFEAANPGSTIKRSDYDAVTNQLRMEFSSAGSIQIFFLSLKVNYTLPLFVTNTIMLDAAITLMNLPTTTNISVSPLDILEKTIFGVIDSAVAEGADDLNPALPIAITALTNLSKSKGKPAIPSDAFQVEVDKLQDKLASTFVAVVNTQEKLNEAIVKDYGLFITFGKYAESVTTKDLIDYEKVALNAYKRKIFEILLPYKTSVVEFSPADGYHGGGGRLYEPADLVKTFQETVKEPQFYWHKSYEYDTEDSTPILFNATNQILLSSTTQVRTGPFCWNPILNEQIYEEVFRVMKFTYEEIKKLPNMKTYLQCSTQDLDRLNPHCRSNTSCM